MNFLDKVKKSTGIDRDFARASNIIGDSGGSTLSKLLGKADDSIHDVSDNIGTLAGSAAGAILGYSKGHPVLGALIGGSLGRNVPALLRAADRRNAMCNVAETGFAVAVSVATPKHPAIAFIIARLVAGAVTHYAKIRE